MATTYAELKTEIADFLNRDDLGTIADTFIDLAESQFYRDIRHWRMETRQVADIDEQYLTKPGDWIETIRVHVTGGGTSPLNLISRDEMADMRSGSNDTGGTPAYYCHAGNALELYPTPSETVEIEMLYYAQIPALSDSNTTNWLLQYYPDVYLYGALLHTAGYLQEDNRINTWASLYSAAVQRLNEESEAAKYSGSGLRVKINGYG